MPSAADCSRYVARSLTSSREGSASALLDSYRSAVRPRAGESTAEAFERVRARLFVYDIFPPRIVGYAVCPDGQVKDGAVVVQRLGVGPLAIESATRVVEIWDRFEPSGGSRSSGFAYVTLEGHPECGVATFEVVCEREAAFVVLTARSMPGTLATRLVGPITRLVQRRITRLAVERLAAG